MTPPKAEFPKDRKVTARFTVKEVERLVDEARRRGEPISSLVRSLVVDTIDELRAKLDKDG